jgi:signal transduction histidine kinase
MAGEGVEWTHDLASDPAERAYQPFLEAGVRTVAAFPVKAGGVTIGVIECFALESIQKSQAFSDLLESIGLELGQVVERQQLQEGYSDAVWQQQRVLAQELHDGLGQELTGLGFLSQTLTEKLKGSEEESSALRLTNGLKRALEQIRSLAKGVSPVAPDSEGLRTALQQLAETTASTFGVACDFDAPSKFPVEDSKVALHLYRIAQEAVTNAVKHARPSRIAIRLDSGAQGVTLSVTDNGTGIARGSGMPAGSGLRIMRYRAAAIGALLTIEDAPGAGTRVACVLANDALGRSST